MSWAFLRKPVAPKNLGNAGMDNDSMQVQDLDTGEVSINPLSIEPIPKAIGDAAAPPQGAAHPKRKSVAFNRMLHSYLGRVRKSIHQKRQIEDESTLGVRGKIFAALFMVLVCVPLCLIGIYAVWFYPDVVSTSLNKQAVWPEKPSEGDGSSYRSFINATNEGPYTYTRFYFYNLTNRDAVVATGATPQFNTVGPYTYRTVVTRFEVVFQDNNGTIRYKERTQHLWRPKLSVTPDGKELSESDVIVQINMVLYSLVAEALPCAAGTVQQWEALQKLAQTTGSNLFVPMKVHERLWGSNDPLLAALQRPSFFTLFSKDGADTADSERRTGAMGLDRASEMTMITGFRKLPWWTTDEANAVDAHSSQFPPHHKVTERPTLRRWLAPIYRTTLFRFAGDVKWNGVKLKRYILDPPEPNHSIFNVTTKGFFALPPDLKAKPFVYSFGNFYLADLTNVNVNVDGFNPPLSDKHNHLIHIDIEPYTGKVFRTRNRLQINVWMSPRQCNGAVVQGEANLPTTWWPYLNVEETMDMTKTQCEDLIYNHYVFFPLSQGLGIASFMVGLLGTVIVVLKLLEGLRYLEDHRILRAFLRCIDSFLFYTVATLFLTLLVVIPVYLYLLLPFQPQDPGEMPPVAPKISQLTWGQWLRYITGLTIYLVLLMGLMTIITSECVAEVTRKNKHPLLIKGAIVLGFIFTSFILVFPVFAAAGQTQRQLDAVLFNLPFFVTIVFIPAYFILMLWAVHIHTRPEGSKIWHIPLCGLFFTLEFANSLVVMKGMTAYIRSDLFMWTSPFLFWLTSPFTRRAAELAKLPVVGATLLSCISLAVGPMVVRLSQSTNIDNIYLVLILESFYAAVQIICRVTLYYRHALLSELSEGECRIRKVPRNPRAKIIATASIRIDSVMDSTFFLLQFILRISILPTKNSSADNLYVMLSCIGVQVLSYVVTISIISMMERIPVSNFVTPMTWNNIKEQLPVFCMMTCMAMCYYALLAMSLWDPSLSNTAMSL